MSTEPKQPTETEPEQAPAVAPAAYEPPAVTPLGAVAAKTLATGP